MTPSINTLLKKDPVSCSRGAPLGAVNFNESDGPLHLQMVYLDEDYAPDGTYWGGGFKTPHLYCAFNAEDDKFAAAQGTRIYVRAWTRDEAKAEVLSQYPDVTFLR